MSKIAITPDMVFPISVSDVEIFRHLGKMSTCSTCVRRIDKAHTTIREVCEVMEGLMGDIRFQQGQEGCLYAQEGLMPVKAQK
jgi:hypothetical protein